VIKVFRNLLIFGILGFKDTFSNLYSLIKSYEEKNFKLLHETSLNFSLSKTVLNDNNFTNHSHSLQIPNTVFILPSDLNFYFELDGTNDFLIDSKFFTRIVQKMTK
jgi:hypothetical protein